MQVVAPLKAFRTSPCAYVDGRPSSPESQPSAASIGSAASTCIVMMRSHAKHLKARTSNPVRRGMSPDNIVRVPQLGHGGRLILPDWSIDPLPECRMGDLA